MEKLLKQLLNRLRSIGETNPEIYDTECRNKVGDAVFAGFLRPATDFVLPNSFGLYNASANEMVREALASYIDEAGRHARISAHLTFKQRLKAFQDGTIKSDGVERCFDDLFGYMPPDEFDEAGEIA